MLKRKYKTESALYCLTGCVRNHLLTQRSDVLESDLICHEEMLITEFEVAEGGIISPIKSLLSIVGNEMGFTLKKMNTINPVKSLRKAIIDKNNTILHIDSKCLDYSALFSSGLTSHSSHYINIFDVDEDRYYVSDAFIPTIPVTKYE